jgi:hypothetical protein
LPKWPENCFEPFGKGGWPPISTWIIWYVESGCSKHMTGDRDNFITLQKERDGLVSFGNDDSSKIIGKCTV